MATDTRSINIYAELDRLNVKWSSSGDEEIRLPCPVHEDTSPSASLNVRTQMWTCFASHCKASGDFVSFIAYALGEKRMTVLADLQTRYPDIVGLSEIPSQTVEKFHSEIADAGPLLAELRKRGISDEMIRAERIGFHDGRITIPVYDLGNRCVNVRRYLPGAPGPQKMRNTHGHGKPSLYRVNKLGSKKTVVICGGEMKAIAVAGLCSDLAAVSSTGGEGHWLDDWTSLLEGRDVCVCMDVDPAGEAASRRIAMALHGRVKSLKVLRLPLDKSVYKKGDVNDWFGQCGATAGDFRRLIAETDEWRPPSQEHVARGDAVKLALASAISSESVGRLVEVEAVIAAADQTPFLVPKTVSINCDRDQPGCSVCSVKMSKVEEDGSTMMEVDPGSPSVIGMIGSSAKEQRERLAQALGIPQCKTFVFSALSHHIARDVRLAPPIDLSGDRVNDVWYPAVIVSDITPDLNVPCSMRGAIYPNPKTQQAVALISSVTEIEDSLSTFNCSSEELEELNIFKTRDDSDVALAEKITHIMRDLESNVTQIYERHDLHLALDVTWHSVLMFKMNGREINGWINSLIIGDSAQGKSEATSRMLKYYGLGDKVDCKNATVAGLLGGLEQLGGRWFVRWGAIPTRDRMLVALEELKGASVEVLSKLTEMRSSGIAEIPKIERRKALARTRLIAISNPRKPRPMASYHYGIEAVLELVGSLEDVRRFDFAMALSREEVSDDVVNMPASKRASVKNVYTKQLCKRLILWAWTRHVDDVIISPSTEEEVIARSNALVKKFTEAVPLIDRGTVRTKLTKIACAIAARTFSSDDRSRLIVQPRHVKFAAEFLDRIYSSRSMGYAEFSAAQEMMSEIQDPDVVSKAIKSTRFPKDLASVMLRRDTISVDDIQSAASVDYDSARTLLSTLVRKGALLRVGRSEYAKNPQFISILKQIRSEDNNRPDTIGDEF